MTTKPKRMQATKTRNKIFCQGNICAPALVVPPPPRRAGFSLTNFPGHHPQDRGSLAGVTKSCRTPVEFPRGVFRQVRRRWRLILPGHHAATPPEAAKGSAAFQSAPRALAIRVDWRSFAVKSKACVFYRECTQMDRNPSSGKNQPAGAD